MRYTIILAALAVAGCANYDRLRETAPQASVYELCRAAYLHNDRTVRQIAVNELNDRVENCSAYAPGLAQERAANAQAAAATLQMMRALQPAPIPPMALPTPPQPIHCNSYTYGNQVQTTCR